jgi:hypothetical protein
MCDFGHRCEIERGDILEIPQFAFSTFLMFTFIVQNMSIVGIKRKVKNVLCVILNIFVRWLGWEYCNYTTFLQFLFMFNVH